MRNIIGLFIAILLFPAMIFATSATATPAGQIPLGGAPIVEPVQYELPYPGMLPNNTLYVLKQVRDWVLDKLIMDPVKKTEFYILQGDKRLAMGIQLSASGNSILSEQTISKGEKYMNNAMHTLLSLKEQGKDVPTYITDHITKSLAKHTEVITSEITKATDESIKLGLTGSLELVNTIQGELPKLK